MENGSEPATKRDLEQFGAQLRSEMDQKLERLEHRFDQKLEGLENNLAERIEKVETNLLKAFYGYAESVDKRFGNVDVNIAAFMNRLSTVETRLLAVEKRLDLPPTA